MRSIAIVILSLYTVNAQSIPVPNASFEVPLVPVGTDISTVLGWYCCGFGDQVSWGISHRPASLYQPPTDGSQVGFLGMPVGGFGEIHADIVMPLKPQTTYVLSTDFYFRKDEPAPGAIGLYLQYSDTNNPAFNLGPTAFLCPGVSCPMNGGHTLQVKYAIGPTLPIVPGGSFPKLAIHIYGNDINNVDLSGSKRATFYFDNVRLEAFPNLLLDKRASLSPTEVLKGEKAHAGVNCLGPIPCQTVLEFIDVHGVLLSQQRFLLEPGRTGFLDYTPPATGEGADEIPTEVVPRLFLQQGSAAASVQIFDRDKQHTRLVANLGDGSVAKLGNLGSGPIAIGRGETGHLAVYCDGSVRPEGDAAAERLPCQVALTFSDVDGRVVKQSQMTLYPSTAGSLDLRYEEARGSDSPVSVYPSVRATGGAVVGSIAVMGTEDDWRTIRQTPLSAPIAAPLR